MKGGEWLARQFEDYTDFFKWTHIYIIMYKVFLTIKYVV